MHYLIRHPDHLGTFLIVAGLVCLTARKKIADFATPPAKERMVDVAGREFTESVVKVASVSAVVVGALLTAAKWYLRIT